MEKIKDDCDKGYKTDCCCNCKSQLELFKHPWNKINKGACSESTNMYACIVQFDDTKEQKAILFEKKHGMCEMHIRK